MGGGRRIITAAALSAAVVAFAVVGGAVWWCRRTRPPDEPTTGVETTRQLGRIVKLTSLTGRSVGTVAASRARQTFAAVRHDEDLADRRQAQTAEQIAESLGDMKGALMKLGQMASFIDQGLPPAFREGLARLQHDAPPMAPALAAQVVEAELGRPPDEVFASWDPMPFAAASIGQVHRALTHDGRAVAVKVQYPGVDEAIRSDLRSAGLLVPMMRSMFPGVDARELIVELRERITEELDYRLEAANQTLFADAYDGHPHIHVPRVDPALSTRRVLTSELVAGSHMAEVTGWSEKERNLAGETIYRFVFGSLYRMHAFNGDPHPGNYLFGGGGRVTFLDFGMVKRFTPEEFSVFERMTKAMVEDRDVAAFRREIEDAGFIPRDLDIGDDEVHDYFGHFYEFIEHDREVTMTPAFASESLRRFFDPNGPYGHIIRAADIPRDMVVIQRINLGLHAVLAELRATANWRRIGEEVWPWARREPGTELGRADARWRQLGPDDSVPAS